MRYVDRYNNPKYDRMGNELLKDYIVTNKQMNRAIFIVSANSRKTAIEKIYQKYNHISNRDDYIARSIGSLHGEHGDIVVLRI